MGQNGKDEESPFFFFLGHTLSLRTDGRRCSRYQQAFLLIRSKGPRNGSRERESQAKDFRNSSLSLSLSLPLSPQLCDVV